jgi:hypothetical protein
LVSDSDLRHFKINGQVVYFSDLPVFIEFRRILFSRSQKAQANAEDAQAHAQKVNLPKTQSTQHRIDRRQRRKRSHIGVHDAIEQHVAVRAAECSAASREERNSFRHERRIINFRVKPTVPRLLQLPANRSPDKDAD